MLGRLANAATAIRWQNPIHVRLWTCSTVKHDLFYSRYQNGLQSSLKKFVGLQTQSSWFTQSIHFLLLLKQIFTNLVASKQFCYLTARSVGQKSRYSIAQVGPLLRVSRGWNQGANRSLEGRIFFQAHTVPWSHHSLARCQSWVGLCSYRLPGLLPTFSMWPPPQHHPSHTFDLSDFSFCLSLWLQPEKVLSF